MSQNTSTNFSEALMVLFIVIYNFAILAGTSYLVVHYDWSMWTYLLALLCLAGVKTGKASEKDE